MTTKLGFQRRKRRDERRQTRDRDEAILHAIEMVNSLVVRSRKR